MSRASTLPATPVHPVETGLDPLDWGSFRSLAHTMLDQALSHIEDASDRPVWQPMPQAVKDALAEPLPLQPQGAERTAADAVRLILPYATGNTHPRFFGWVHGAGQAGGVIAEMLSAAMNSNAGGRDHGAIHVERQVIDWFRKLYGFPPDSSGLLVSGTSMATLIALTVARNQALGPEARRLGLAAAGKPLVAYTSKESHSSVARAIEMLGLGTDSLRALPTDAAFRLPAEALRDAIRADKAAGKLPFAVIASAGTVNTGAIDPLAEIADVCAAEGVWLHVDGAFGALLMLSDKIRSRLTGIERADSLAFDFHKWLHVPYDAACVLVRDGAAHRAAFTSRPTYLAGAARGLAAGESWPCDFGPELSRGFRALKVWFALKEHGTETFAASIEDNCRLARLLGDRIAADPHLELLAPVTLNIACFRLCVNRLSADALDQLNEDIVAELQLRGIAAPSTTRIGGKLAIRANITNHRTRDADIGVLLAAVRDIGAELAAAIPAEPAGVPTPLPFEFLTTLDAALSRPEIIAVCGALSISIEPATPAMFRLAASGQIRLSPDALTDSTTAAVLIRHAAELAALAATPANSVRYIPQPYGADGENSSSRRRPGSAQAAGRHSGAPRQVFDAAAFEPDAAQHTKDWTDPGQRPDDEFGGGLANQAANALLAARTAGRYLALLPSAERHAAEAALPEWLSSAYRRLSGPLCSADLIGLAGRHDSLLTDLLPLSGASHDAMLTLRLSTQLRIEAVNAFARRMDLAAPVEHLLTHGGDVRIKIDPATGRNSYGSSARPVAGEIGFSSSTATCISVQAYAAVDEMRHRLMTAAADGAFASAAVGEMEALRSAVLAHSGAGSVAGASCILTASGTDAELATLALALAHDDRPLTSIVISPEETGSGVPQATLGRHFSSETALGLTVTPGAAIEGLAGARVQSVAVAIRNSEGQPRSAAAVGADVDAAVSTAVTDGRRVLLHVLDAAKTGIGAPALAGVLALTERFGDALDVVVDACQARLGTDAVAAYLERGWLVQITGSKFWGGPPFSGALLVPERFLARQPHLAPLLASLKGYMARGEWPAAFDEARQALPERVNLGLLSRWRAAVTEADRIAAVDADAQIRLIRTFVGAVTEALPDYPELRPVSAAQFDRSAVCANDSWSDAQTIFPVIPMRMVNGATRPLTLDEAKLLHRWLARDVSTQLQSCDLGADDLQLASQPCHVGQPVKLGTPGGRTTGALRLCASARTVLAMAEPGGEETVCQQIDTVLAKIRLLLRHLEALPA